MATISSWSLWIAGAAAILNALGIGSLNLDLSLFTINVTPLIVAAICFFNAVIRVRYGTSSPADPALD